MVNGADYTAVLKAAGLLDDDSPSLMCRSYYTSRYGQVNDYRGSVEVTLPDGRRFLARGVSPRGTGWHITKQGGIEVEEVIADD